MLVDIPVNLVYVLSPLFLAWGKAFQEWLWDGIKGYKKDHDSAYIVNGFLNLFKWITYGFLLFVFAILVAWYGMEGDLLVLIFFFAGTLARGNKWAYQLFRGVFDFLRPIKDSISEKVLGKEKKKRRKTLS